MRKIFLCLSGLLILLPMLAFSSYYAHGYLEVKIISINGEPVRFMSYENFELPVTLLVKKFIRGDGHNPNHAKVFVGKTFTVKLFCKNKQEAKSIKGNQVLPVQYTTENGLGFDPVTKQIKEFRGDRWNAFIE